MIPIFSWRLQGCNPNLRTVFYTPSLPPSPSTQSKYTTQNRNHWSLCAPGVRLQEAQCSQHGACSRGATQWTHGSVRLAGILVPKGLKHGGPQGRSDSTEWQPSMYMSRQMAADWQRNSPNYTHKAPMDTGTSCVQVTTQSRGGHAKADKRGN